MIYACSQSSWDMSLRREIYWHDLDQSAFGGKGEYGLREADGYYCLGTHAVLELHFQYLPQGWWFRIFVAIVHVSAVSLVVLLILVELFSFNGFLLLGLIG